MKRISFLFLTTSFIICPSILHNASAKSFRTGHGIAFDRNKIDLQRFDAIETASGDEVVHDIKDPSKNYAAQIAAEDGTTTEPEHVPEPKLAQPEEKKTIEPIQTQQETPVPLVTATKVLGNDCANGSGHGVLYSFYYSAPANIKKVDGGYIIETTGGTVQHQGALYSLQTIEIIHSNPMHIKLSHKSNKGDNLVVMVPIAQGDLDHHGVESIMNGANIQYINAANFVPTSHDYNKCTDDGVVTFLKPIEFSTRQIERLRI